MSTKHTLRSQVRDHKERQVREIDDDLNRRLESWRSTCDEYAKPRAEEKYQAWLDSMRAMFLEQAREEFASQRPAPDFAMVADLRLRNTVPEPERRASVVAELIELRGTIKPPMHNGQCAREDLAAALKGFER